MKKTTIIKELRGKDDKALFAELAQAQEKLVDLRFKASFRKLKNYQEIGLLRKKIAWIWTILSERAAEKIMKEEKETVKNGK